MQSNLGLILVRCIKQSSYKDSFFVWKCVTIRRLIMQWNQEIFVIISWNLPGDQRPQTIRILHGWNKKTTRFQSKSPCPKVVHLQPWSQITKLPYTNNTNRSNLTYLNKICPFYSHGLTLIPAWISNHMPSKILVKITYPFSNFYGVTFEVWECISKVTPHFRTCIITYSCCD